MKKLLIAFYVIFFLFGVFTPSVFAKKFLPRARPATSGGSISSGSRGVTTFVKFRDDRLAIVINFSNLAVASSVSYTLSYNTRGTTQGAGGSLTPDTAGPTASRELLFGTCSHGICKYDYGITNARLVVTTNLPSGRRVVKSFRLKV